MSADGDMSASLLAEVPGAVAVSVAPAAEGATAPEAVEGELRVLLVPGAAPGGGALAMCVVGEALAWPLTKGVRVSGGAGGGGAAYERAFALPDGVYTLRVERSGAEEQAAALDALDAVIAEHAVLLAGPGDASAAGGGEAERAAPASEWLRRADLASEFLAGTVGMVQAGLQAAVPVAAAALDSAGAYAKGKLTPAAEPVELSEATKQRIAKAKRTAELTATVSGVAVEGATSAAVRAADALAERLKATELAGRLMRSGKGSDKTEAAAKVASAGFSALTAIAEAAYGAGKVRRGSACC